MVWFYLTSWSGMGGTVRKLSIPLWSDFICELNPARDYTLAGFQSHYGLILSSVVAVTFLKAMLPFNPTMVWFYRERDTLLTRSASVERFQSHYGLILSDLQKLSDIKDSIINFQSHYGLILSRLISSSSLFSSCSFNPTMVWFYLTATTIQSVSETSTFNPTMVWFYQQHSKSALVFNKTFQSHYGLILSACRVGNIQTKTITFNPTMVWFYHGCRELSGKNICSSFNPTMVWFYHCTIL